jgi:hypothetical protein
VAAVAALGCAAVALSLIGCGGGTGGDAVVRDDSLLSAAAAARWVKVARLPDAARSSDGADLETIGGIVYAAVVESRHGGRGPLRARVWALRGARWAGPVGGRRFELDADTFFWLAADGSRPCVVWTRRGRTRVSCLDGSSWAQRGGVVLGIHEPSYVEGFARIGRRLVVQRTALRDPKPVGGGGGIEQTALSRSAEFRHGRWQALAGGPVFARHDGRRWREIAPPLLEPADFGDDIGLIMPTAVTVAARTPFVGVARFERSPSDPRQRADFDWLVLRLVDGAWRPTTLGGESATWSEQGRLYDFLGHVWTIRFDQRQRHGTIAARFQVDVLDPATGSTRRVGEPLLDGADLYSTIEMDLTARGRDIYALHTCPNARRKSNEICVRRARV